EHDRLQPLAEERQRDVARRVERGLADPELAVHDRRGVESQGAHPRGPPAPARRVLDREVALAARGAALVDENYLALDQALRELLRIADRGRRADEMGPRGVAHAQPPPRPEAG